MSGPLQMLAVRFGPEATFPSRVLEEIDRLEGRGLLRVVDVVLMTTAADGEVHRLIIDGDDDYGTLLAGPLGISGAAASAVGSPGFDLFDAKALVGSLVPGSTAMFLLIEQTWAASLLDAIADSQGTVVAEGFLTPGASTLIGAELAAMEAAGETIVEAQAAEVDAILTALSAQADAAEVVAASQAISNAAVAGAVRTLVGAGLVEQTAIHQAVDALISAGLIVAATDDVVAEAVESGAATIRAASVTFAQAQVLRYLPTPMSFAVIAGKLGISRGAARERAERLYRKLGVHSRADAVLRARHLGLID